jgi:RNA polymerase sigma-70 factor (ECF subfamily)
MNDEADAAPLRSPELEELLSHSTWMRGLARRVLDDEQRADDAVQETWIKVLRRPPAQVRDLPAWLATIVRTVSIQLGRADRRLRARERSSAMPEPVASTLDVAARAELHRRVVAAVLALQEPYRSTILSRFFDRWPPRRIARERRIPVATVHTQLQRGLAQLRARLDPQEKQRLRALVALPWEVMVVGAKTKVLAAAAIFAIGGVAWFATARERGATTGAPQQVAAPSPSNAASAPVDAASGAAGAIPAASRVVEPPRPRASLAEANAAVFLGRQRVRGRVVDVDHAPIEGARVAFAIPGADEYVPGVEHEAREELDGAGFHELPLQPPTLTAVTDASGAFEIDRVRAGLAYSIRVAAEGFGERTIAPPFGDRGVISLGPGGTRFGSRELTILPEIVLVKDVELLVHVVDERGASAPGVAVWHGAVGTHERWDSLWTASARRTDGDGRVSFPLDADAAQWLVARADDGREAVLASSEGAPRDRLGATLLPLREGAPLEVSVRSTDGVPLPGLRVWVSYFDASDEFRKLSRDLGTDDDGRCSFANVPRVARSLYVDAPGGCMTLVRRNEDETFADMCTAVAPDATTATIAVPLEGPALAVRFVDAATRAPVRATRLLVVQDDFFEFADPSGGFVDHAMPGRGLGVVARDGTRGLVLLAEPGPQCDGWVPYPRGRQRESFGLVVDAPGFARTRLGPFDPGKLDRSKPLELALERGVVIAGTLRDASGAAIEGARLHVPGAGPGTSCGSCGTTLGSTPVCSALSAANGSFWLGPLARGEHEVVVTATGFLQRRESIVVDDTKAGAPIEIVVERGVSLRGRVLLDPDEEPSRLAVVACATDQSWSSSSGLDDDGTFELGPLPPRAVRLLAFELDFLDPEQPARFDGRRGIEMAVELRKRLGLAAGAVAAVAPPAIELAPSGDLAGLELEPLRGARARRLDLVGVLRDPMPDLDRIDVFAEFGESMERESVVVKDGRFRLRVGDGGRSLIAVRERFRADPQTWPDSSQVEAQSWYVLGRIVAPDEMRRGAIELAPSRGSLVVRLRRPADASFEAGSRFQLCYSGFFPDWRTLRLLPQICNNNGIILPVPASGRMRFDSIPAGTYQWVVFLPGEKSARFETLEVRADTTTEVDLALDR